MAWRKVASKDDLKSDEGFPVQIDGCRIGLYLVDGEVFAIGDNCPHQAGVLLSEGWFEEGVIECPMHQSRFDVRTGNCLNPPALEDVPRFEIRVEGGDIFVDEPAG